MKFLQLVVGNRIAKGPNEKLRVEDVFPGRPQGSVSGDAIGIPSMAFVPRINALWKTTRSKARSMVSVAVAAPSARCAACSFERGKRYVRGTRRSRA